MANQELFVQFLLKEIKYNPNWYLSALNRAQIRSHLIEKRFTKTPPNHELAVKLFMENPKNDISKFYKDNYVYEHGVSFILGSEFHPWADKKLDILQTKRVGPQLYIVTQCIPSDIVLLPIVQLARRKNKRISPDMLVQHLIGEINLIDEFLEIPWLGSSSICSIRDVKF